MESLKSKSNAWKCLWIVWKPNELMTSTKQRSFFLFSSWKNSVRSALVIFLNATFDFDISIFSHEICAMKSFYAQLIIQKREIVMLLIQDEHYFNNLWWKFSTSLCGNRKFDIVWICYDINEKITSWKQGYNEYTTIQCELLWIISSIENIYQYELEFCVGIRDFLSRDYILVLGLFWRCKMDT